VRKGQRKAAGESICAQFAATPNELQHRAKRFELVI